MDAGVIVISATLFVLLAFTLVGGPMVLTDWVRKRRQAVIARQIELTDALDGRLGAMVAPVVTKPLFRPWEVRIAVPLICSSVQARMISVIDDVFAGGEGVTPSAYRIILTVADGSRYAASEPGAGRPPDERWADTPMAAA